MLAKIRAGNPALARHFTATIKTGYFCAYRRDADQIIVSWVL